MPQIYELHPGNSISKIRALPTRRWAIAIDAFNLDWSPSKFFAFPPFSVIPRTLQKKGRQSNKDLRSSRLANPGLVRPSHENAGKRSSLPQAKQGSPLPPKSTSRSPPNEQELTSHSLSLVGKKLINTNNRLSNASQDIMLASWCDGTAKQYKTYLVRWDAYCNCNDLDLFNPGIENATEFLTDIFKSGSGYSAINLGR